MVGGAAFSMALRALPGVLPTVLYGVLPEAYISMSAKENKRTFAAVRVKVVVDLSAHLRACVSRVGAAARIPRPRSIELKFSISQASSPRL